MQVLVPDVRIARTRPDRSAVGDSCFHKVALHVILGRQMNRGMGMGLWGSMVTPAVPSTYLDCELVCRVLPLDVCGHLLHTSSRVTQAALQQAAAWRQAQHTTWADLDNTCLGVGLA
jgi:hypothetical protein